jgi:DNA-directed RNA polymerase specialized sigma24 family protein
MVAETPQRLTVILGRTRAGDGRARCELILEGQGLDVVAVHEALDRLAALDGRQAQVMTLRYFGGMTVAEVATALGVSVATTEQDWRLAQAWLAGQLGGGDG